MAVESTDKPVKIEVEILQKRPTRALIEASRSAALLCVGSIGLKHSSHGPDRVHRCGIGGVSTLPSRRRPWVRLAPAHQGWVVAEVDGSPTRTESCCARCEEARLRGLPLRVLTTWQSRYTDIHETTRSPTATGWRRPGLTAAWTQWRKRYPDLDIEAVAVHGSTLNYFAKHAELDPAARGGA